MSIRVTYAERAKLEGFKVDMVVVADDCSLPPPLGVAGKGSHPHTLFSPFFKCKAALTKTLATHCDTFHVVGARVTVVAVDVAGYSPFYPS